MYMVNNWYRVRSKKTIINYEKDVELYRKCVIIEVAIKGKEVKGRNALGFLAFFVIKKFSEVKISISEITNKKT